MELVIGIGYWSCLTTSEGCFVMIFNTNLMSWNDYNVGLECFRVVSESVFEIGSERGGQNYHFENGGQNGVK